jgi:two-component system, sensor histidine kinase and response regulator
MKQLHYPLVHRSTFFYSFLTGLVLSVLILFGFIANSYLETQQLYEDFRWVEHTYQVIDQLEASVQKLIECEGSVRGYALTHDKEFISTYPSSVRYVHQQLRIVLHFIRDNASQQTNIKALHQLVNERFALLDTTVALLEGRYPFSGEAANLARLQRARLLMDRIRAGKEQFRQQQEKLLKQRRQEARNTLSNSLIAIALSALAGLAVSVQLAIMVNKYIRQRKQVEDQLKELNENKNRFFSIISHDLRGPLTNGNALLKMLRDERRPRTIQQQREMLAMIHQSVENTFNLLEDLLEWSKAQMEQMPFQPESLSIYEAVECNMALLQANARQKDIDLLNQTASQARVFADRQMLNTMLRNLLSNAIKFTPPHGRVTIYTLPGEEVVSLVVEDSGVGMSAEVIRKLFSVGERHSTRGTADEKGSGLGLILCQEFVARNSGTITVESTLGQGSRFRVNLQVGELVTE